MTATENNWDDVALEINPSSNVKNTNLQNILKSHSFIKRNGIQEASCLIKTKELPPYKSLCALLEDLMYNALNGIGLGFSF